MQVKYILDSWLWKYCNALFRNKKKLAFHISLPLPTLLELPLPTFSSPISRTPPATCFPYFLGCLENSKYQSIWQIFYDRLNPLTPASNCLWPTLNFLVFFLKYFRAIESKKINHVHSNHRHKIRHQDFKPKYLKYQQKELNLMRITCKKTRNYGIFFFFAPWQTARNTQKWVNFLLQTKRNRIQQISILLLQRITFKKTPDQPGPIIVRFTCRADWDHVWSQCPLLAESKIRTGEDLLFHVHEIRKNVLVPALKKAQKSNGVKVHMTWKIFSAYLKGLSKSRRLAFFFLKYLFSF